MNDKCTVVNIRREAFDVYIGRAGHVAEDGYFGNPFVVGRDGTRAECITNFQVWFQKRLVEDPEYRRRVLALRGKRLGCFCAPAACHGDVIAAWVNTHLEQR